MMVIGLTGSIAMGKSEAAKYLTSLGFPVFDADAEVHKLYDSKAGADLIQPFVPEATTTGKVDRQCVTAAIMQNPDLLALLEKKVHEAIREKRLAFLAAARASGAKAAILDIPLLFETGGDGMIDKTIVVSAPATIQRQRALARPGMTAARFDMILARQMPDAEKRARADAVIDNSSTVQQMQKSLYQICAKWGLIDHA